MKISIIIPAFNVENYIEKCLISIRDQLFHDYEIIIVNDGSTDRTEEVIKGFIQKNRSIRITLLHSNHQGPSIARNMAMDIAKGEYLSFIDADDTVSPIMYKEMYEKASLFDADLVLCGRAYVYANGQFHSTWNPLKIEGVTNIFKLPRLLSDTSSFVWDKLFKTSTIKKSGLHFDSTIHYAEDALFIYSFLYFAEKVASIQKPFYYYTIKRENSITGAMDERMLDEVKACELLTIFYINSGYFDKFQSWLLWICIGFWGRKFYDVHYIKGNKKIMFEFVKQFYEFLAAYYPKWQEYLRKYSTKGSKRLYKINKYRTNLNLIKLYIFTPSSLFRAYKKIDKAIKRLFNIALHLPAKIKNRLTTHEYFEPYLNARKRLRVVPQSILYVANSGDNIACNVYALMKEAATRLGYKLYVGSKSPETDKIMLLSSGLRSVTILKMNSPEFQKILATANYLVCNYRLPTYFTKRKEQIVMNTWHGTPLKTLGRDMNNGIIDLGNVQSQFLDSNYLLYPNEYTKKHMVEAFCLSDLYQNKILVEGYPRNDVFFDDSYIQTLKNLLKIQDKKVYVYMPTWRGLSVAATSKDYNAEINSILSQIDAGLNDDVLLFVKMHNLALKYVTLSKFKHIRPFPNNFEIYYFLNIADALITDYSSVFYDFANTKKEIILFTYDKELYCKERGLYENIDTLPFTQVDNTESLIAHLNNRPAFVADKKYLEFLNTYCSHDSIITAQKVNNIFLSKFDLKTSAKKYNAFLFADPIISPVASIGLDNLLKVKNPLAIIATSAITDSFIETLKNEKFKKIPILVVQNENILSKKEQRAFNKRKLSSITAKKAIIREKERMMPTIDFETITNCSSDPIFAAIEKIYKK